MPDPVTDPVVIRDQLAAARSNAEALIRAGRLGAVDELRAKYPAVWESADAALELVYAEYVVRRANGETPDREDWFRRYPDWRDRLERLFGLYDLMAGDTHRPATTVGPERPVAAPPTDIDHPAGYEVLGELGRGGMAMVYRARNRELNRVVALKVLRWGEWDSAGDGQRVRREAELLARLQHPNIVQVFEVGEWDGDPFLALEYVAGGTLADALTRRQRQGQTGVTTADAVALVGVLAAAVQAAHEQGVVHRDLKPANVLLVDDPAGPFARPKVTDFGLAISTELSTAVSQTTALAGTPAYMAPEQADARRAAIGPRTDVYALGGLLYELLTGRPPFQGATVLETLDLVRQAEPVSPRQLRPNLPRDLETVCLKCLSKDPARRYQSAAALADDLARFRDGKPILARPVGALEKGWKWVRRKPWLAGLAAALVLAVTLGVAGVTREYLRAEDERAKAVAANDLTAERLKQIETINGSVFDLFAEFDLGRVKASEEPVEQALAEKLIRMGKRLDAKAIQDPLVLATLHDRLGRTLLSLGEARAAVELLTDAVGVRTAALGPNHPDTLSTTGSLGTALQKAGQPDQALRLLEQAHDRCLAHLGRDHPETPTAMNNLAAGYAEAGKLDRAIPLYQEALALQKEARGDDHQETLTTTNNLALAYREARRRDEALPLFEAAFAAQRAKLGEGHQDTLNTMNNLALCHHDRGDEGKALPLFERAVALHKTHLGGDHPQTLVAINNLASVHQEAGRMDKALPLYEEAFQLKKGRLGLAHPGTLTGMANLALAYQLAGQLDKALPLYEEAVAARKVVLGPRHKHTLLTMGNLASGYQSAGRLDEAIRLFQEVVALQTDELGRGGYDTLISLNNLALAYREDGQMGKAVETFEEVVKLQKARDGPDHDDTHFYMANLAITYDMAGRPADAEAAHKERLDSVVRTRGKDTGAYASAAAAYGRCLTDHGKGERGEPLLRECLVVREKTQPDHWGTFNTRSLLGGALLGQEKYADAEPLLVRGYEGMKARDNAMPKAGGAERLIPEALDRLIALYTATNKPDEVKKYQELRARYPTPKPKEKK
jgi:tetratricopeptide (TPR) repeat protein/tRNA A-37 threonylcarbamoyl transferase component Bud32